ncbi:amino acid adenylation domain-containing protein [Phytomonospora sp. NPDC050363]|uniref:amino acid adenylation domain-containing protein n=1 Tax=Phytomonospora sp. NPDC050363 TaxID=3155642 RepID=UPI0033F820CE
MPDTLHARFTAVAARHPDRIAVSDGAVEVTYRELDEGSAEAAAVLAAELRPGERLVALRASRGVLAPAGMLAIMRAGAGYVPIDPGYPEERRAYIAADSRVSLVLTDRLAEGEEAVASVGGLHLVRLESPGPHEVPDDVAYVIYTSGSTGNPKGCVVGHGHVLSLMDATAGLYDFGEEDVWTLFHSTSFDFSVWEVWGPLLSGGRAVVVHPVQQLDPLDFAELLERERVTVLNQVPSVFGNLVVECARNGVGLPGLRYVIFGGEAVNPADVRAWWSAGISPDCALVNMYGITETTVHASHCPLDEDVFDGPDATTPIGIPLPNLAFSLRDEDGEPVADGEAGELWVSGGGAAHGYLDRAELTAERFVTDSREGDERRYYRSGDWAVRDERGAYHYIGRRDGQVKLNGFRIELGEVESTVASADGVRQCVCVVEKDSTGGSILVAHIATLPGREVDLGAVRQRVAARLPAHMCTLRYQIHRTLPLTGNGKVDRRALVSR